MLLLVGAFLFAFEGSLEPLAIVIIICGALVYGLMMVAFLTRSAGPMKAAIAIVLIGVVWTTAIVVSGLFDGR
jgi:hypothetical protein